MICHVYKWKSGPDLQIRKMYISAQSAHPDRPKQKTEAILSRPLVSWRVMIASEVWYISLRKLTAKAPENIVGLEGDRLSF